MLAFLLLSLAPAPSADVIVVDWFGNGDFDELQPAIDAAHDGDVLGVLGVRGVVRIARAKLGLGVCRRMSLSDERRAVDEHEPLFIGAHRADGVRGDPRRHRLPPVLVARLVSIELTRPRTHDGS